MDAAGHRPPHSCTLRGCRARRALFAEGVQGDCRQPVGDDSEAPVGQTWTLDEDGSFHLAVPPNTPIQLQIVDRDGMALRTSAWIWAKNKENRGCIGCHEDGERTPENVFAKALGHDAAELMLPAERRRTVDFRRDIQPILTAKCASSGVPRRGYSAELGSKRTRFTAYGMRISLPPT